MLILALTPIFFVVLLLSKILVVPNLNGCALFQMPHLFRSIKEGFKTA